MIVKNSHSLRQLAHRSKAGLDAKSDLVAVAMSRG